MSESITVYVSIGNSDDKLPQREWSSYVADFRTVMEKYAATIYGVWFSGPESPYQNACVAAAVLGDDIGALRADLLDVRQTYDQDSVAWAVTRTTEFI